MLGHTHASVKDEYSRCGQWTLEGLPTTSEVQNYNLRNIHLERWQSKCVCVSGAGNAASWMKHMLYYINLYCYNIYIFISYRYVYIYIYIYICIQSIYVCVVYIFYILWYIIYYIFYDISYIIYFMIYHIFYIYYILYIIYYVLCIIYYILYTIYYILYIINNIIYIYIIFIYIYISYIYICNSIYCYISLYISIYYYCCYLYIIIYICICIHCIYIYYVYIYMICIYIYVCILYCTILPGTIIEVEFEHDNVLRKMMVSSDVRGVRSLSEWWIQPCQLCPRELIVPQCPSLFQRSIPGASTQKWKLTSKSRPLIFFLGIIFVSLS